MEAEPLVSSEWLLRGEGEMLKSQPTSLDLESKTNKTSAPHQIETKNINIDLHGEQIDSKRTIEVLFCNVHIRTFWLQGTSFDRHIH